LIADFLKMQQGPMVSRLKIAVPLFVVGFLISVLDFNIIWRYFAWANQTTAMIMLWAAASYLHRENKCHWIASVPATFMSAVSMTYILQAPEGFGLPTTISYPGGLAIAVLIVLAFVKHVSKQKPGTPLTKTPI
jgi:carbon starvation protein CstA